MIRNTVTGLHSSGDTRTLVVVMMTTVAGCTGLGTLRLVCWQSGTLAISGLSGLVTLYW